MRVLPLIVLTMAVAGCKTTRTSSAKAEAGRDSTKTLSLNDVSILFPIKADGAVASLPRATDKGEKGFLLPASLLKEIGDLGQYNVKNDSSTIFRDPSKLVPVALRFDPCFPVMSSDDSKCIRQLRIVWQRPEQNPVKQGAGDEALHGLYRLSSDEFSAAIQQLARLKAAAHVASYDDKPLDIHPIFAQQNVNGQFGQGVVQIIKKYAGQDNLQQIAFINLIDPDLDWNFGAADIVDGHAVKHALPTLNSDKLQNARLDNDDGLTISSDPEFRAPDSLKAAADAVRSTDDAVDQATYSQLLRIENPNKTTILSTDCMSCHMAGPVRANTERAGKIKASTQNDDRFASSWPLTDPNQTDLTKNSLHNFSYFGDTLSVNQRVINETALVVDWINQHEFGAAQTAPAIDQTEAGQAQEQANKPGPSGRYCGESAPRLTPGGYCYSTDEDGSALRVGKACCNGN